MTSNYAKAYTEVLKILCYFPEEEYAKIPTEKIEFYKQNMDLDYNYEIDSSIDLSEQYISKEANIILLTLFRDYFATEQQKDILKRILDQNQEKLDEEKRQKYHVDNIFQKNEQNSNMETVGTNALIEVHAEKWYEKILSFFKKIFQR